MIGLPVNRVISAASGCDHPPPVWKAIIRRIPARPAPCKRAGTYTRRHFRPWARTAILGLVGPVLRCPLLLYVPAEFSLFGERFRISVNLHVPEYLADLYLPFAATMGVGCAQSPFDGLFP